MREPTQPSASAPREESQRTGERPASLLRTVLIAWAAAWPAITIILLMLEEPTRSWPLALRTLLLTGLMVPAMVLILVPALNRIIALLDRPHA